jgi:hypothetical protein
VVRKVPATVASVELGESASERAGSVTELVDIAEIHKKRISAKVNQLKMARREFR